MKIDWDSGQIHEFLKMEAGFSYKKFLLRRRIGLGLENEPPFVEVDLGNFPNVNLWSPPGYPFACIEPMVSHHDLHDSPLAIEKKRHLMALPGGQSVEYHFSIIIEEKSSK